MRRSSRNPARARDRDGREFAGLRRESVGGYGGVSDDLCGTFGDAETLKGDASALRETRSTVAGCIPQPTAPHKTRGQRIPLPPKLLAVTGLALDHGGYQLDIALRDHGLLLIEMRSCFGPRKTRKDAELEGRGRVLLEVGVAEAAGCCLGKSVGWRAMAPLFRLILKRYGASRPAMAGGCCGRQIPQSHAKCARHR